MARIKRAVNAHKKRRKVLKLAKGYFGAKSKQYRTASEQVRRSLRYAYIGRKRRPQRLKARPAGHARHGRKAELGIPLRHPFSVEYPGRRN